MDIEIPEELALRAAQRRGPAGVDWIRRLGTDIAAFAVDHDLRPDGRLRLGMELAVGFRVLLADGQPAVLRAVADRDVVEQQATVLRLWRGGPAVDLLAVDLERRLLLLEGLEPDHDLHTVPPDRAVSIACDLLSELWLPTRTMKLPSLPPPNLSRLEGLVPADLLTAGRAAWVRRTESNEQQVILHGDLHRGNVLAGGRQGWTAIDPSPKIGPAAHDLAILLSDLMSEDVGTAQAGSRLVELVARVAASTADHSVEALAVLDWMLLHRIERVAAAVDETGDPSWDAEFAALIAAAIVG